jgi:hypothetical protein
MLDARLFSLLPVDSVIPDGRPSIELDLVVLRVLVLEVRTRRGSILAGRSEFQEDVYIVVPIASKDTESSSQSIGR